jgi:hypothetical protein
MTKKSSQQLLAEINTINENFWRNLRLLNFEKHKTDINENEALENFKRQINELELTLIRLLTSKTVDKQEIDRLENELIIKKKKALETLFSDVIYATDSLLDELFRYLHDSVFQFTPLNTLLRKFSALSCDQLLDEIDDAFQNIFDSPKKIDTLLIQAENNFITVTEHHHIIAQRKPSAIQFDKRRAFELLHSDEICCVLNQIHQFEKDRKKQPPLTANFQTLQSYNPIFAKKNAEHCQAAFIRFLSRELGYFDHHTHFLEKEYRRAEKKRPLIFLRPFYGVTNRAVHVWQYELLCQEFNIIQQYSNRLKKIADGLSHWFQELNKAGVIGQLLPKDYRDSLIELVLEKQESILLCYQKSYARLQKKSKRHQLGQDVSLIPQIGSILQTATAQLLACKDSPLATIDDFKVHTMPARGIKKTEESWRATFALGEPIPKTLLPQFIAKEIKSTRTHDAEQLQWLERVQHQLLEKIQADDKTLSTQYEYIKQAIELFLQLKKDSFLTAIKDSISRLPEKNQKHPIIKYCAMQIGRTVAERLVQIELCIVETNQTIKEIEDQLNQQRLANKPLARHLSVLTAYVQNNYFSSVAQLLAEQKIEALLIIKAGSIKQANFNAMAVLEQVIELSQRHRLLHEYQQTGKQLSELKSIDTFVSETVLPIPNLEQLIQATTECCI